MIDPKTRGPESPVLHCKVGEGTYGVVHRATWNDKECAIKKFRRLLFDDQSLSDHMILEITVPRYLNHKNVMKLDKFFNRKDSLWLAMPYYGMDLHTWNEMHSGQKVVEAQIKKILYQIAEGLNHLHTNGILHRDLKCRNILIQPQDAGLPEEVGIKIIDFGSAQYVGISPKTKSMELNVQTLWYRAPEILLGQSRYDYGIDVWSFGCIAIELLTHRPAFPGDFDIDQLYKIFKNFGTPDETTWPGCNTLPYWKPSFPKWKFNGFKDLLGHEQLGNSDLINLLKGIMQLDPVKRFNCQDILMHPYFLPVKEIRGNSDSEKMECDTSRSDTSRPRYSFDYYLISNQQNMLAKERHTILNFHEQSHLNLEMVNILNDWLLDVRTEFKLCNSTLMLGFQIFNRFLAKVPDLRKSELQLSGIACISLANKIHEVHAVGLDQFVHICDNAYTSGQIKEMEFRILEQLDGDLIEPTPYEFLKAFCADFTNGNEQGQLVMTIVKSCIYDQLYHKYLPSVLTSSAIQVSDQIFQKLGKVITLQVVNHSGEKLLQTPNLQERKNKRSIKSEIMSCLRKANAEKRDITNGLIREYFNNVS